MKNFGERLKSARLMMGLSLEDLAQRVESTITKQALHKYENGTMKPGSEILTSLCKALGVSTDYFAREKHVNLDNLSFRKKSSLKIKAENQIREQARDYLERYLELESLVGKDSRLDNPLKDFAINGQDDIELATDKLREIWNLGDDPLFNILELLEDHQIKVVTLHADHEFSGFSTWADEVPIIVLNQTQGIPLDRLRFTALHELGHLLLNLAHYSEKERELYCHRFAGAMLISKARIIDELGFKRNAIHIKELGVVKQQYGISISALLKRAEQVGVLTPFAYRQMCIFLKANNYWKQEPFEYAGQERAQRFKQLLIQGYTTEVLTTSKAAALNRQNLSEFRKELTSVEL